MLAFLNRFRRSAPEATKRSAVAPLVAFYEAGRPVWSSRDYAGLAREGYQRNPVAYRCVRLIAEAAASVPILLFAGRRELDEHPILTLLAQPNPSQTGQSLLESVFGHLMVSGNAYVERVAVEGIVRELYALRPDRVAIVPGADGWACAYDYTVGGHAVRLHPDADGTPGVLHLRFFNPLDDHYGFAPMEAAAAALDIHNAASGWNKALLDNAARPSGALVYSGGDGGHLSPSQFERLKDELEANFQGAANAGRPLLLEGGLDWKPLSLSPKELDFIEAKASAAREIALAFGVPPMLLGIPGDATYANYQEANRAFWRQCVLPLASRTAKALVAWLASPEDGALRAELDLDRIEALSHEREALWRRLGEATFLTEDEKREAVGYGTVAR